jgi:hypothetical protein
MRTIWTILTVLALANLLALAGFVGWLGASDRVDMERVREVRKLFSETLTEKHTREATAKAAEEAAALAAAEKAKRENEPVPAADLLRIRLEAGEADRERLAKWRREVEDLKATLQRDLDRLDAARKALADEQAAFDARKEQIARLEGDGMFKKALATYEGLKPTAAAEMMLQLLRPGGGTGAINEAGADQTVAYLNAMEDRTRTKIITEFQKQDAALAAELLERLRTRATLASGPGNPGG